MGNNYVWGKKGEIKIKISIQNRFAFWLLNNKTSFITGIHQEVATFVINQKKILMRRNVGGMNPFDTHRLFYFLFLYLQVITSALALI